MGRRLSRILLLLPYAIRHPGVSVAELAGKFGVDKRDLLDDLQLVFLCGLPGYGPGDLIDVDLQGDRVYIRMADYFGAPLRLTPAEALVLYAGAETLTRLPEMEDAEALRGALTKLGRALGAGDGDGRPTGIAVALEPASEQNLATVRRAIAERKRLQLGYFSASRGELTDRKVDPWGLVAALGRWYLVGWDHFSGEERMFRMDRAKSAALLDEPAEVPDDFDPEAYKGAFRPHEREATVTFEISPAAARWFEDYYPVQSADDLRDGWRRVTLISSSSRWAATLILQLGKDVRAVEPKQVVETARSLAADLSAKHAA